jgi:ElaA protein
VADYQYTLKPFAELTPFELYNILKLRSEVFVVEQNCVYQDMDSKDLVAHHLMVDKNGLVAYARLLPPGVSYPEMSIGRIVTSQSVRGTGAGKWLVQRSIEQCFKLFGKGAIRIGAQLYARKFYEQLGFKQSSDVYDEDGIEHIEMVRQPD